MKPGHSAFVIGPSGTGKSSLARDALIVEGSGIVVSAPGDDERASYVEFDDEQDYEVQGFNDVVSMRAWLGALLQKNMAHYREHQTPLHKLVVYDTMSGMDQLIRHSNLKRMNLKKPPKARSADGADFYLGVQYDWENIMAVARSLRGFGTHWLGLCHVKMRAPTDTAVKGSGLDAPEQVMPMITGSSRDAIPAAFDLMMHTTIVNVKGVERFVMQWKSDPKKVAKSRFGDLADNRVIPNEWTPLLKCIDHAIDVRKAEFQQRRAGHE